MKFRLGRFALLPSLLTILVAGFCIRVLPISEAIGAIVPIGHGSFVVVAEGGASAIAPPSSLTSYALATELGADFLQAEIRESSDGALVAYHQNSVHDSSDALRLFPTRAYDPINSMTFHELSALDLGVAFGRQNPRLSHPCFGGSRMLSLPGLASLALRGDRRAGLFLTLPEGVSEEAVSELLKGSQYIANGQIVVEAVSLTQLRRVRLLLPNAVTFLRIPKDIGVDVEALLEGAEAYGARGVNFPYSSAFPWYIRRAKARGLAPWVRDVEAGLSVRMLKLFGAEGVFTKDPEGVLRQVGRPPSLPGEELLNRMDAQSAISIY